MTRDYMPKRRADRYVWWKNLFKHLSEVGPKLGLTEEEIEAAKAEAADQMAKMEAVDHAERTLKGARTQEKHVTPTHEATIRLAIRNWKTRPAYGNSGAEGALRLKGAQSDFHAPSFKPEISLSLSGGRIKLDFTKGECEMVAIYSRLEATADWTRLGTDMHNPYYDTRPLATPGVPETREYRVIGIIDDQETGQPSDIARILFGG